jgi:phospholipase C
VPAVDGIFDFQRADALIATVYEALRNTPEGFDRWMLLITYDEHGGLFDRYPPEATTPPGKPQVSLSRRFVSKFVSWGSEGFDFASLGVRVPAVVVGPRVPSKIDDTIYDHASIVATLRDLFNTETDKFTGRVRDAKTFHGLASLPEPRPLPSLEPYVSVGEPSEAGLDLREALAATASPHDSVAGGLSSELARLNRGVQWRSLLAHPVTWALPSLAPALRLLWPSRRRRLERETRASATRDPHADTVDRFQREASRARGERAAR